MLKNEQFWSHWISLCWQWMKSAMEGNLIAIFNLMFYVNTVFSIILDADAGSVVSRVALRTDDIPLGEQTVAQVTNAIHSLFW